MQKRLGTIVLTGAAVFSFNAASQAQNNLAAKSKAFQPHPASAPIESDRIKDGLVGPVRRVRTEIVKLDMNGGKAVEGKRTLLEVVAYDIRGNKVENQYFPVSGSTLTGKEVYKYDDKGNISEMTLLNEDGSLVGKEAYKYEFDFAGNWNKMTTTVAVVEGGKLSFEPTEVTYRSIMYYLDANFLKKSQPAEAPSQASSTNTTANLTKNNLEAKAPAAENTATLKSNPVTNEKSTSAVPLPSSDADLNVMSSAELERASPRLNTNASMVQLESEPPSLSPKPLLKPVSGGVLNGTAVQLPSPGYPDMAKRMKTSGVVTVDVVIDEYGKVISAKASAGPATLREAAVQAAMRARFSPTTLSGQPVKVSGVINYKFSLE